MNRLWRVVVAALVIIDPASSCAANADPPPSVPAAFRIEAIARVPRARELAIAPSGDLLVGTLDRTVELVAHAEGKPAAPVTFVRLDDDVAAGVALTDHALFIGTRHGVWQVPYAAGDRVAREAPHRLFAVRTTRDGGHITTSVAVAGDTLFASVGSSCNACDDDPARAAIFAATLPAGDPAPRAIHFRNAMALAVDPATGHLWAAGAGQDELAHGHPFEIFDDVGSRPGVPDYGWPTCYEDRRPVSAGVDCRSVTVPLAVFPAYETPIGAAFYPAHQSGPYAFPAAWRGGAFVALHGSWHRPLVPPRVAFVPIDGDRTAVAVNWSDPAAQWREFISGWQRPDGHRIGRPTGVAVGPQGSLFIADDDSGTIYRIRPNLERAVSTQADR